MLELFPLQLKNTKIECKMNKEYKEREKGAELTDAEIAELFKEID